MMEHFDAQEAYKAARREKNRKHALTSRQRKQDLLDSAMHTAQQVTGLCAQIDALRQDMIRLQQENAALRADLACSNETLKAATKKLADEQFQSICSFRADLNFIMFNALPNE
jgi:predicted aminopeptidase